MVKDTSKTVEITVRKVIYAADTLLVNTSASTDVEKSPYGTKYDPYEIDI